MIDFMVTFLGVVWQSFTALKSMRHLQRKILIRQMKNDRTMLHKISELHKKFSLHF